MRVLSGSLFLVFGCMVTQAAAADRVFEGVGVDQLKGVVLEALIGPSDKTKCRIIAETVSTLTASCEEGFLGTLAKGVVTNMFSQYEGREVRTEPQFAFVPSERGTRLLMQSFDANMYRSHGGLSRTRLPSDKGDQQFLNALKIPRQSAAVPIAAGAIAVNPSVPAFGVVAVPTVVTVVPVAPATETLVVITEPSPEFLEMIAELSKLQKEKSPSFEDLWEALPLSNPAEDKSEDVDEWVNRMKQPSAVAIAVGASGQMTIGTALGQPDQDGADAQALGKCNALAQAEGLGMSCGIVFRSRKIDVETFQQQMEVARKLDYREWLANMEASLLKWEPALFE